MNWLTRWFLDNPVAANLLMAFILVAGFLSLNSIRVESFPQIAPSSLTISVSYPGGTPEQIDQSITQRIESAISGVAGIKTVVSSSYAGLAQIQVTKTSDTPLEKLKEKIRNEVESIVGFPEEAERPRIVADEFGNLASFIIIHGSNDQSVLQQAASQVRQALKKHPAISQVTNLGKRKQQLVISPDNKRLQTYGLSSEQLANQISQWSLEYRSGELKTGNGRIILRGDGFANNLTRLRQLPLISNANGTVLLRDVADISRQYQQNDSIVRFNKQSAIALLVSTSVKDNLLEVSEASKSVLNDIKSQLPEDIKTDMMADMAPYITEQLNLLSSNALQGLLIVLIILGIFLELKLAFWVALGIPVSLAGALWMMDLPQFNYSINDITLFGMILVLGVLVDDAVVVGESIYEARKQHSDSKEAAWHGVRAVSTATTFGVLTTIAAFSPMLWIDNELAKLLAGFSAVVIFALMFSLIESKFILPSHLSTSHTNQRHHSGLASMLKTVRKHCQAGLSYLSNAIYQPALKLALQNKITTLMLFSSIMLFAWGGLAKGLFPAVFFPEIPGRYGTLTVTMDQDAPYQLANKHIAQLELAAQRTSHQLQESFQLSEQAIEQQLLSIDAGKKLELTIALSREALETVPAEAVLNIWQANTGSIEGSYSVTYSLADEPAGGTAITISAQNREMALQVTRHLKQALKQQPGVAHPWDDSQSGQRQLEIKLNAKGIQLGLKQRDLAVLVGGAYGELEIHKLLEQGEEVSVLVSYPEQAKKSVSQLQSTAVALPDGGYVPLGAISEFRFKRTSNVINRRNRDQVITLSWRQNREVASPEQVWSNINENVVPKLLKQYPGVKISAIGEFAEISEVQSGFKKAMLLTLLLIYVLLAVPLKSYFQPLIIMSVIPFGFAGAVLGHAMLGVSVSILSMFGMMAMTGVVINDSLVLMTRFNHLYRNGLPLYDALLEAGKSRMQAIFLTTVTTVCGLLPLLSETSETAQYLKPAAISLVFGELLATPITLILIPVLLALGKQISEKLKRKHRQNLDSLPVSQTKT